ncbi:ATP-binding protein [bacterium]|nr:ATP-binding protein [bacterium]
MGFGFGKVEEETKETEEESHNKLNFERPQKPTNPAETGMNLSFITDLVLKTMYGTGVEVGGEIADELKLSFEGVVEPVLRQLKDDHSCEIIGGGGVSSTWRFVLMEKGIRRALDAMTQSGYIGPAPVPLNEYFEITRKQSGRKGIINREGIKKMFSDLIISDKMVEELGPAMNATKSSLFLYGKPGNGKTSIAERMTALLGGPILVPYAVTQNNQVIKLFDELYHQPLEEKPDIIYDARWVLCKRPTIVVGGELTLADLDLIYVESAKFYEAPFQMKANGGLLLIDDFGRQKCSPVELLNRWIVPLEKNVDYLALATGKKITVPFDQIIVYSTNLDPGDLVDEAFLRRIQYKIEIPDPDREGFTKIFELVCNGKKVEFKKDIVDYLIETHYISKNRPFRACHPRDLLNQAIDYAHYRGLKPELTKEALDYACESYFVEF